MQIWVNYGDIKMNEKKVLILIPPAYHVLILLQSKPHITLPLFNPILFNPAPTALSPPSYLSQPRPHTSSLISPDLAVRYLIPVCDVWIRKLSGHQLIQNDAIGINVGLETVRIVVLHSDHLGSLERKITEGKRSHLHYIMSTI